MFLQRTLHKNKAQAKLAKEIQEIARFAVGRGGGVR